MQIFEKHLFRFPLLYAVWWITNLFACFVGAIILLLFCACCCNGGDDFEAESKNLTVNEAYDERTPLLAAEKD